VSKLNFYLINKKTKKVDYITDNPVEAYLLAHCYDNGCHLNTSEVLAKAGAEMYSAGLLVLDILADYLSTLNDPEAAKYFASLEVYDRIKIYKEWKEELKEKNANKLPESHNLYESDENAVTPEKQEGFLGWYCPKCSNFVYDEDTEEDEIPQFCPVCGVKLNKVKEE
jgi:rubrerythrin